MNGLIPRQRLREFDFVFRVINDPKVAVAPRPSRDTMMDIGAAPFEFSLEIVESIRKDVNRSGRIAFAGPEQMDGNVISLDHGVVSVRHLHDRSKAQLRLVILKRLAKVGYR